MTAMVTEQGKEEKSKLSCFKSYDIRGTYPNDINESISYKIGRSFVDFLDAREVLVGYDVREESSTLRDSLVRGLLDGGSHVVDIGLCGSEEVYYQTCEKGLDGGIMITASHNPIGYGGMKLIGREARPISGDTGLRKIENMVVEDDFTASQRHIGRVSIDTSKQSYIAHLLSYVDTSILKPLKIIADPGNGSAGPIIRLLEKHLPFNFILLHEEPDGTFPNGIPNPLLPENRKATSNAVVKNKADLGIAWDGDFDRCFFYDADGRFIEGYYMVGLISRIMLQKHHKEKVIHDPRLTWNTIEEVKRAGGIPVQSKTGHAFIKERMRSENAVYGGEMSAHHYFRDFAFCDSGMIPWLLITELISRTDTSLAELVDESIGKFPCSGEINFRVADCDAAIERVLDHFADKTPLVDYTDGVSMEFNEWRFNLRASNTEPLLRLNVETRGDVKSLKFYTSHIEHILSEHFV